MSISQTQPDPLRINALPKTKHIRILSYFLGQEQWFVTIVDQYF